MNFRKRLVSALVVTCALCASFSPVYGCSRLFWNDNKIAMIAARTMDLYTDEHPTLQVQPMGIAKDGGAKENSIKWTSKYGSVVVSAFGKAVSDGINDQGLSCHVLYLHVSGYEKRDQRPALTNALWVQYVLDNYKTVDEVVNALNQYQVVSLEVAGRNWPLHLVVEDVTGDSAIVEFIEGKMVVHHGKQYTVVTNDPPYNVQLENLKKYKLFGGNLPLPGDTDPLSRFVRVSSFLKTLTIPSTYREAMAYALGVIRTVQVPFGAENTSGNNLLDAWPTRWITASDLTNEIYYFNSTTTSPNIAWVEFKNLKFTKGLPVLELDLHDDKVVGEVSAMFKPKAST